MKSLAAVARSISVMMLLAPAALAQPPRPSAAPAFRISGTVVAANSSAPLARTLVTIVTSADRSVTNMRTVKTGPDGHFVFESLRPGKYNLQAERGGFSQQAFDEHDGYSTAIAVGPGLQSDNLLFRLRPDAVISGRVLDEQNDTVRNAQVLLYEFQSIPGRPPAFLRANAISNDEGSFSFDHLVPGKYLVAVSAQPWYAERTQPVARFRPAPNSDVPPELLENKSSELDVAYPTGFYPAGFDPATSDPSHAAPMVLAAGSHENADIVLRAAPALHLRLLRSNAEPINQVTVKQQFLGNETLVFARTIRYENDFEITGLAPGHYLFEVHSNSPGAASRHEVDATGDDDIDLSSSLPAAIVTGSVTLESSQPLPRTFIQIQGETGGFGGQISPDGKVTFNQPVPPGRYTVNIGGQGLIIKSLAATGATVSGQTLLITGQSPVTLAIVLSKSSAQVDGVVLENGKPVSGAMVLLVPDNPANNVPLFRRDQSDSDGTFTLRVIVPGKYALLAIKNGWDLEWANPATLKPYMREAETIQVEAKGKYQVKVKLQASSPQAP